ncbi:retrovirus-related pol polyprotein from transposon TNT 1-94 [Tanacetum coccineum]
MTGTSPSDHGTTEGSCDQQALESTELIWQDTITSLRIQLDGLKVENVSLKRRYDELSKANTHSRTAYTAKLSALTTQHTKLQAQVTGTTSSGPSTSKTPKVLAPGMYNLGSKYIPPPKRANWVKPTPLPKKRQVTFSETSRPSLKPTQNPVVHHNKQTNVCVPMSTGVKPTSGASKTMPKRAPRNHNVPKESLDRRIVGKKQSLQIKKAYRIYNKRTRKIQETVHVAFDELTEGLTSVQTSSGLAPQQMTSVPNSTELELTALQSGRSHSELVKDPEPPSVPPTKKHVDDLFPWFDDDEVCSDTSPGCSDNSNNILIIPLKWIFKIKLDEYGDVLKNKARLVAKGYRQEAGLTRLYSGSIRYLKKEPLTWVCGIRRDSGLEHKSFADADMQNCHEHTEKYSSGSAQFLGHRLVSCIHPKSKKVLPSPLRKLRYIALGVRSCA